MREAHAQEALGAGRVLRQTITFSGMGACSNPVCGDTLRPGCPPARRWCAGQLAQHAQVALAEEVGQRLLHLFGGVNFALSQARPAALSTVTSTFTTSLARFRKLSGTVSRMTVLAERLTASLSVSRCWMLTAAITLMPASQQFQHIFVALAFLLPERWCGPARLR